MADMVTQKNIAAYLTSRLASPFAPLTAGGAGNGVVVTGGAIQRSLIGMPRTAALIFPFSAALTAAKTLALTAVSIMDSADGITFAPFSTFTDPGVVATGPTGNGTVPGAIELSSDLSGARDFVRVSFTPTLSNTAADTATVAALLVFSGFDRLPAPS